MMGPTDEADEQAAVHPQIERIARDFERFNETANFTAEAFGVDVYDIEIAGANVGQLLAGAGLTTATIVGVAQTTGAVSAEVSALLGVSVSAPMIGLVIGSVAGAVFAALRIARAVRCGRHARSDRDSMRRELAKILDLIIPADVPNEGELRTRLRRRLYEALPYIANTLSIRDRRRGAAHYGDWSDGSLPAGMAWTDGTTGRRRGVDWTHGGASPCDKELIMDAHRRALRGIRQALELEPLRRDRGAVLVGILAFYLGQVGNPFRGLEGVFTAAGVPMVGEAQWSMGVGRDLDASSVTTIGVFGPEGVFTRSTLTGGAGGIVFPYRRPTPIAVVVRYKTGVRFAWADLISASSATARIRLPSVAELVTSNRFVPLSPSGTGPIYVSVREGAADPAIARFVEEHAETIDEYVPGTYTTYRIHAPVVQLASIEAPQPTGGGLLPVAGIATAAFLWLKR